MLFGANPFELLREENGFKGHVREYTMHELERFGTACGFSVLRREYCNYWAHLFPANPLLRVLEISVPSFRSGLTILLGT
jgi:hypothetical protein